MSAAYDWRAPLRHGNDPGCPSCGTCIEHDGCADAGNPLDPDRGDCPECGACRDCISYCATTEDPAPPPLGPGEGLDGPEPLPPPLGPGEPPREGIDY